MSKFIGFSWEEDFEDQVKRNEACNSIKINMSKKYTIEKEGEIPFIDSWFGFEMKADGKVEITLTEQEVRELASQLPENQDDAVDCGKAIEVFELLNEFIRNPDNYEDEEIMNRVDEILYGTDDDTTHLTASQAVYAGVGPDGEPLGKVSDCCGAEVGRCEKPYCIKGHHCQSCGEPCEAVNPQETCSHAISREFGKANCVSCGAKIEYETDTKPDPIEPLRAASQITQPVVNKINEVIEYLNKN